jgi:hypothetical protein
MAGVDWTAHVATAEMREDCAAGQGQSQGHGPAGRGY